MLHFSNILYLHNSTIFFLKGLMPCLSPEDNVISCKLVSVYPKNAQYGISSHIVYVLLFDATSGKLLAIMVKCFFLKKKKKLKFNFELTEK